MKLLNSTRKVIIALGGNRLVADLVGSTPKAVSNWRRTRFPANTYVILMFWLNRNGYRAPNSLWAIKQKPTRKKNHGTR
jgi:hypothetical protein